MTLALAQFPKVAIPVHSPEAEFDPAEAETIVGGLSSPSKMPCYSTSISAWRCGVGSALAQVKGSTCEGCYARKGCYNYPNTKNAMERRYVALADPRWVAAMAFVIMAKTFPLRGRKPAVPFFRWHDSGDLQSVSHLRNIVTVAILTPSVSHWIPTREYGIVRKYLAEYGPFPANLTVRVSAAMIDGSAPADFPVTSEVVASDAARDAAVARGASIFPAPTQGNECRDCRACWNREVATVAYWKH